jgi:hypothetical protein
LKVYHIAEILMSSRRQSRVLQGEKTNIGDVDLGSLLSIRSRDKTRTELLLPLVSKRSPVSTPGSDSRLQNDHRLKTGASCASERGFAQSPSRGKIQTFSDSHDLPSNRIEKSKQVEKLRKEFIERNTLHFTKLREAFRTIDKDHNGCKTKVLLFLKHFLYSLSP